MTAKNRAGAITKLHASLKKHYKPAPAAPGRPLLEHILYAALLEDAPAELADEGFAKCEQEFFDWNEVRVTSVTELAEVLTHFPSPPSTAARLKRCLQSVFETFYNFDIDHLKKENLGKAVAKFESMSGMSPFVLAYLVQHGLGGHAIPVSSAAMQIMSKAGIVSEAEARSGKVPGLERAIPKSKAIEFSSMLHQAAVALQADPQDKTVWEIILSVNEDAQLATSDKPRKKSSKSATVDADAPAPSEEKADAKPVGKSKASAKGTATKTAAASKDAAAPASKSSTKASKPAAAKAAPAADAVATPEGAADDAAPAPATSKASSKPVVASGSRAIKGSGPLAAAKKGTDKAPKKPAASKRSDATKPPPSKETDKTDGVSAPAAGEASDQADEAASGESGGSRTLAKQKPR